MADSRYFELAEQWQVDATRLAAMKYPIKLIAKKIGKPYTRVRKFLFDPAVKKLIAEIRLGDIETHDSVWGAIQMLAPFALEEMVGLMRQDEDKLLKFHAAKWLLEASGHTPLRRLEVTHREQAQQDLAGLSFEQMRDMAIAAIKEQTPEAEFPGVSPLGIPQEIQEAEIIQDVPEAPGCQGSDAP